MQRRAIVLLVLFLMAAGLYAKRHFQATPVEAYALQAQPLEQWVVASGQVRFAELTRIGSEITGTVRERLVREGDDVKAGQVLVVLRNDDLLAQYEQAKTALSQLGAIRLPQAQEALKDAQDTYQQAAREAERRAELVARGMIPKEQAEQAKRQANNAQSLLKQAQYQVDELKPNGLEEHLLKQRLDSAQAQLAKTKILSPYDGRIQWRDVEAGDVVQPSKILFELAREEGLEVVVAVDEKYIGPLALGQKAVVIADAWPTKSIEGEVGFISPSVDESSGTLNVHIKLHQIPVPLRLGMTVSASMLTANADSALVVSNDFIEHQGASAYVFTLENGRPTRQPVSLGLKNTAKTQITTGAQPGDVLLLPSQVQGQKQKIKPVFNQEAW